MAILTNAEYAQVRAALDIGLTTDDLPDATIALDVYQGRAEAQIERRVGAYDDLSAADQAIAKRAAVLLTAAFLLPALPRLLGVGVDGLDVRYADRNWEKLAAQLQTEAWEELGQLVASSETHTGPVFFGTVKGRRGR